MNGFGFTLALGAALGWGTLDAVRKHLAGEVAPLPLAAALQLLPAPLFVAWALRDQAPLPTSDYVLPALCALCVNLSAALAYVNALRRAPLSATVPLLALTPALSTLGAWVALGEAPGPVQAAGLGLVLVGAGALVGAPDHRADRAGLGLMGLVAALFAAGLIVDKWALRFASLPVHASVQTLCAGGLLLGAVLVSGRGAELRGAARANVGALAVAGALYAVAIGLQLAALPMVWVGGVDAMKRGVGLSLGVLNGWLWFGERLRAGQVFAIAAMGVGVVLLAAG